MNEKNLERIRQGLSNIPEDHASNPIIVDAKGLLKYAEGLQKELSEVEQILGKALGYPAYADDQKNFPGATEKNGVCVGEHTAATLAMEAADLIRKLSPKGMV